MILRRETLCDRQAHTNDAHENRSFGVVSKIPSELS